MPTNNNHYHVTFEDAIVVHEAALLFGGLPGIRDVGSIQSAIARPYSGYYSSIEEKAAALVHSLSLNHGFLDGNKRTALGLLTQLLTRSGFGLRAPDNNTSVVAETEAMILDIVEHKMDFKTLVEWMRARIVLVPPTIE